MSKLRKIMNKRIWAYGLFWSWNLIFLAFMLLGFAPTVLPEMLTAVRADTIPAIFLLYAAILTLIPVIAVILGFTLLRREPDRLFALGYGVEGPIMLILAIRFFVVRQATTAVSFILITAGLGILTYLWLLLDRKISKRPFVLTHLKQIGLTLLLIAGLYAGIWIAFYALPAGVQGIRSAGEFFTEIWHSIVTLDWQSIQWRYVPFTILGVILFVYTGTLFVLMPITVTILYARAWWQGICEFTTGFSRARAAVITTAVLALIVTLFVATSQQPQHKAFALLEEMPTNLTEAAALQTEDETIRAGLLNAYLAPQRYLSSEGEVRHISEIYEYTLEMEPESSARVQQWYEAVAQPILYQPVEPVPTSEWHWENQALRNEPAKAAELYKQYFDEPINDGEREEVIRAARSTWAVDQAMAAWQAVDDREILLTHQELTITEHEDWAEMELYEVYQNQTVQRQEVVYYFTLPETAVLTGIWLGTSADRASRFSFHVAPRGAAQATYQNEVQRQVDPALLEQIGPSQYRLRVFPIEPMQWNWNERNRSELENGLPMHMWLTWQVMSDSTAWPLPYLSDKFNVYWTDDTIRLLNGSPMDADAKTWLPLSAPFVTTSGMAVSHQVNLANGQTVTARPFTNDAALTPDRGMRLAVVLDRSRSMEKLADDVQTALATIAEWGTAVDVYLTASPIRGEAPSRTTLDALDVQNILYFGGQNPTQLLHQFTTLAAGESYDAIFVLTDGSGYELGAPEHSIAVPDAPIWMVHLGGHFPIGYDDETLTAVQASGGGTVGSVDDAMNRLMAGRVNPGTVLVDGYKWTVMAGETAVADANTIIHTVNDQFTAFAARQFILAQMAANRGTIDQLDTLDTLHAIAIENSIVTPFSSMIVLVNTWQAQLLEELSSQEDRFDREFEAVGETMMEPVTVTGVPEPEEWLLIGIILVFLLRTYYTNRREQHARTIA